MEQNYGRLIDFPKNLNEETHYLATKVGFLNQNIFQYILVSLFQLIHDKSIWLHEVHKVASRAACDPWAAGWKALPYSTVRQHQPTSSHIFVMSWDYVCETMNKLADELTEHLCCIKCNLVCSRSGGRGRNSIIQFGNTQWKHPGSATVNGIRNTV